MTEAEALRELAEALPALVVRALDCDRRCKNKWRPGVARSGLCWALWGGRR